MSKVTKKGKSDATRKYIERDFLLEPVFFQAWARSRYQEGQGWVYARGSLYLYNTDRITLALCVTARMRELVQRGRRSRLKSQNRDHERQLELPFRKQSTGAGC